MSNFKNLSLILTLSICIFNGTVNAESSTTNEENLSAENISNDEKITVDEENLSNKEISTDVNISNDEKITVDEENLSNKEISTDVNISDGEKEFGVMSIGDKNDGKEYELQLEYLSSRAFTERRDMHNYNVHLFQKGKTIHAMSIYYGLTFTRATGYNIPYGIAYDSNGAGVGPAMLLRWEKRLNGKLYGSLDFSGSFMFYNKAHPYDGRAYGFLWRVGSRLIWKYDDKNSFNLGYNISHFSNAMRKHNPGYNTMGFSIGLSHEF